VIGVYGGTCVCGPKHVWDEQENAVLPVVVDEVIHGRAVNHLSHIDGLLFGGEREAMHEPAVHGIKSLRVPGTHWKAPYWNAINPLEPFWSGIDTPVAMEVMYTSS
jgi:hypothetical protein